MSRAEFSLTEPIPLQVVYIDHSQSAAMGFFFPRDSRAAMGFFSKGLKNEFETAVVNELSVFEPLKL